jgi:hypothetical protein
MFKDRLKGPVTIRVPVEVRTLQPQGLRSPKTVSDFIAAFRKVIAP